jgi:cytosine/creatinine deaminase
VAQMTSQKGIKACFEAVTGNAAEVMQLQAHGIAAGCDASFVLLQAGDVVEALRLRANRLRVWRQGKLVAQTPELVTRLEVGEGRAASVSFSRVGGAAGR